MAAKRSGSGWASPERRKVWTEPNKPKTAAVVYYLCRQDGQLDHPHFLHVPLHHPPRPPGVGGALYLRDVIARLADLRGAAMPAAYSWSAKRAYRNNAYVWHDLADDDLILPAHADEYVLKGSPKLPPPAASARNRWTSFDRAPAPAEAEAEVAAIDGDMSPPPSSSSPDAPANNNNNHGDIAGRMRPSAMLMQLISCGSIPRRGPRSDLQQLARVHGDKMGMDRDYFSGSLVETTTTTTSKSKRPSDGPQLRRSSSCNGGGGTANRQRGGADNDCGGMR